MICPETRWGTDAINQTGDSPFIVASGIPSLRFIPSFTPSDVTAPAMGDRMPNPVGAAPDDSAAAIADSGKPNIARRDRAADASSESPDRRKERYSPSAADHSGERSTAMRSPRRSTSPTANRFARSTYPVVRDSITATSRSLNLSVPDTLTSAETGSRVTSVRRRPRFCSTAGSMLTVATSGASPAYRGTRSISMNGDFPGSSKCWSGTIGSYQYRISFLAAPP